MLGSAPLRRLAVAGSALVVLAGSVAGAGGALARTRAASPRWAPAATAAIHPGVQTVTGGSQCTANFVYVDGRNVYLGQAAHCSGTDGSTATNGCTSHSLKLGTPVQIAGASHPGRLVYNSWLTMQARHEKNADTCQYNDLALVRIDPRDVGKVNPTVPVFGGPTGLDTTGTSLGDQVYTYGNSELRLGLTTLSPKYGVSLGDSNGGWNHDVYTLSPGIPGDSGSGILDSSGRALGVLSTIAVAPLPGANGVGDLAHELAYMRAHSGFTHVRLVPGTQAFAPPI